MTIAAALPVGHGNAVAGWTLVGGITLACLTDAIASTALALSRGDIIGDTYATPDQFAWLDMAYTALKLIGFAVTPWVLTRISAHRLLLGATLAMGGACAGAMMATGLEVLIALRAVQGLAGALLLVCGQAILFWHYPRNHQPTLQALFAMGSVVAPATLTPALQGWLVDSQSWNWIFFSVVPVSLAAAGLILMSISVAHRAMEQHAPDWIGTALLTTSLASLTFVLSQGNRWDWFEADHIGWLSAAATVSLALFLVRQKSLGPAGLLNPAVFRTDDFTFAFIVSFVAGAALFGSAYLIPAFAVAALNFTPTDAGLLLLDGSLPFIGTLLLAALLMQRRKIPPVATVPFGILLLMAAMWTLSGSTSESGADDMHPVILLRGFGLGFLFLSITLIAFTRLPSNLVPFGIAIFNIGRQLGGLIGVAGLQTIIDHEAAGNRSVLGAAVTAGTPAVADRLALLTASLVDGGMEPGAAARAATGMLGRAVSGQAGVIAFNTAFAAVTIFFLLAIPIVVATKILLSRTTARRRLLKQKAV